MRERLRDVAEAAGLLDVMRARKRIAAIEEGLAEHRELQAELARQVDELAGLVASLVQARA